MTKFTFNEKKSVLQVSWAKPKGGRRNKKRTKISFTYPQWRTLCEWRKNRVTPEDAFTVKDHWRDWTFTGAHNFSVHAHTPLWLAPELWVRNLYDTDLTPVEARVSYNALVGSRSTKQARNIRVASKLMVEMVDQIPECPERDLWPDRIDKQGAEKLTTYQQKQLDEWPTDTPVTYATPIGKRDQIEDNWTNHHIGGGGKTLKRLVELGLVEVALRGIGIDDDGNLNFNNHNQHPDGIEWVYRMTIAGSLYRSN